MTALYIPGLAGEIAQHLNDQSPIVSPRFAVGGSIALLGAIVGAGWELPHIEIYSREALRKVRPNIDFDSMPKTRPIKQNVMLVGESWSGKEEIILGVDQLQNVLVQQYPSASALWRRLRIIPFFNHLTLAGMEPDAESVRRMRGFVSTKNHDKLLEGSLSLLVESTPMAFNQHLPFWYENSEFYGECLMIGHRGAKRKRNRNPIQPPSTALIGRITLLADMALNQVNNKVLVNVSDEAAAKYRLFWNWDMDNCCKYGSMGMECQLAFQAMQVATIIAVGVDPIRPTVAGELFGIAIDLVSDGIQLARTGLQLPDRASLRSSRVVSPPTLPPTHS